MKNSIYSKLVKLFIILSQLGFSACGMQGDLYLPEDDTEIETKAGE